MNSIIVLVGRILLAAIFILAGFAKLTDISGTAALFRHVQFAGAAAVPLVLATSSGSSNCSADSRSWSASRRASPLGRSRCSASPPALISHYADWRPDDGLINQIMLMKNLAMAGGFLVLGVYGAGALSVDAAARRPGHA